MSEPSLVELIGAQRVGEAVELAHRHPVDWVIDQLDYDTLDQNSEAASAFLQAWCQDLPPLPRLRAADWAAGQYVTALVHLDHAYGIAARLVLEAQQAVASYLATSLRDTWVLADGPDAELDASVARRLNGYAASLEAMDFAPTWTAGAEPV